MISMANHTTARSIRRGPSDGLSVIKQGPHQYHTTGIERMLLLILVILIPLEPSLPTVAGFTSPYIMFAVLTGYILLNRPGSLARTWSHPVFLAAFCLLMIAILIESAHPLSDYTDIFRIGQMFVAAIFVASLCRDRPALRAGIYGFLLAGVLVSILLVLTTYGTLQQATATTFGEASKVRREALEDVGETLVGLAVTPARGAAVALAFGLMAKSALRRNLFLGITLLCLIGAFLPMSRGGMVIAIASCATVIFAYGVRHVRVLLITAVLAVAALIWVPEAVFARFTLTPETPAGKTEIRTRIYKAALENLPQYALAGVGAGNFWGPWGMQSDYYKTHRGEGHRRGAVLGAHNVFIQFAIFWGLAALLGLIVVVYLSYRCLPRGGGKDVLVLCLYGIAVSLVLQMMVSHVLTAKEFSLGLGLLVGGHRWIWPQGLIPSARRGQGRRHPAFEHA